MEFNSMNPTMYYGITSVLYVVAIISGVFIKDLG